MSAATAHFRRHEGLGSGEQPVKILRHRLEDPPPIHELSVTIRSTGRRSDLVDALDEIVRRLVHRGIVLDDRKTGGAVKRQTERISA